MSGYIGPAPVPQATQTRQTFTATSGQTSFATAGYTAGFVDVYMNGVRLVDGTDFAATNGSDVVLTSGAATGDVLETVAYTAFTVADQDFTGTTTTEDLTVTGAFTSQGIDDNATATAMTLDASGNLLVSKTSSDTNTVGAELGATGYGAFCRDANKVAIFNRKTNDGTIIDVKQDGSTVGLIGNVGNNLYYSGGSNLNFSTGLLMKGASVSNTRLIAPSDDSGTELDDKVSLGRNVSRFRNLFLSGGVYLGGTGSANQLTDYETGTWTPEFANVTAPTYVNQDGNYTKIGDICHFNIFLEYSGLNTGDSSALGVTLPFNASNADYNGVINMLGGTNNTGFAGSSTDSVYCSVGSGLPRFAVVGATDSNYYDYDSGKFNASGRLYFSGTYTTA